MDENPATAPAARLDRGFADNAKERLDSLFG